MEEVHIVLEIEENIVNVVAVYKDEEKANSYVKVQRHLDENSVIWYETEQIR